MTLRSRLRRLERERESEMIAIPQRDGSVARFTESAARDAVANVYARLGAGEDAPDEHPMVEAIRNAATPEPWHETYMLVPEGQEITDPVPDLSEP